METNNLTNFAPRATLVAHALSSSGSKGHFSGSDKIKNELMSLVSFNNFPTSKYISILASCLPQMQLALTTSLQLVVCVRKLVTKPPRF